PAEHGRAPARVGRDRTARRQHDALSDHKIARAQDRRQPDRKAEADQTVDPLARSCSAPVRARSALPPLT
ncbi:MAG TPA: hypothetical protein VHQ91_07575, partial [Geminicoccaceae bacterium]|nr:hypothetical protein [Geminicoccaceae bacterium]